MTEADTEHAELDHAGMWRALAPELTRYATLLVGPVDAVDVVSTAFMRAADAALAARNPRRYLMRAVTNTAIDQHRSRQRRQVRDLHAVIPASVEPSPGDIDVRRAVAALSVQQRAVVYFTYWEDLDSNQIADVLGVTPDSVRRHLARARLRLRKALA